MSRLQSSDSRAPITFRVDESTKEAYKEHVNSMSGDLREYVSAVGQADGVETSDLPSDETLRAVYLILLESAGDNLRLKTEAAESVLAEKLTRPKTAVRSGVLKPLKKRGLTKARWGVITVQSREGSGRRGVRDDTVTPRLSPPPHPHASRQQHRQVQLSNGFGLDVSGAPHRLTHGCTADSGEGVGTPYRVRGLRSRSRWGTERGGLEGEIRQASTWSE